MSHSPQVRVVKSNGSSSMKVSRANEDAKVWFRSERVFLTGDNDWWFQTREGVDIGPYETQFEAEIEAGLLKELLRVEEDAAGVESAIRQFVLDSYSIGRPLRPCFREPLPRKAAAG